MSMEGMVRDLRYIDDACDHLAQACWDLSQTNDWVAASALLALEGILDDLGDRYAELKEIRRVMDKFKEERDGVRN